MAGELMTQATALITMGLHPSEIIIGFEKGAKKTIEILETLEAYKSDNLRNQEELTKMVKTTVASKQFGLEDFLAGLIAEACIYTMSDSSTKFSMDNIRVQKILGGGIQKSFTVLQFPALQLSAFQFTSFQFPALRLCSFPLLQFPVLCSSGFNFSGLPVSQYPSFQLPSLQFPALSVFQLSSFAVSQIPSSTADGCSGGRRGRSRSGRSQAESRHRPRNTSPYRHRRLGCQVRRGP